jgi:cytochrome c oxidase subunit 3
MGILQEMGKKPWLNQGAPDEGAAAGTTFALPAEKVGLRVFLGVITVVFSLMVIIYSDRMTFADWQSVSVPWLLWVNTALLVLASLAFHKARESARAAQLDGIRSGLFAGGALTIAFLAGQLFAWQQLVGAGHYASSGPAVDFFYMLTAAHGLHMVGGLVAWGRTMIKVRRGVGAADLLPSVDLCTAYWHYLLMIWIVLFGLLLFT